jgi:DUF1365 family protein
VVSAPTLLTPALYPTVVRHARSKPLRHAFHYRNPMWLLDLEDMPTSRLLGGVLRFEARDHLGDPSLSIRSNVVAWAAAHGVDVGSDQILMLTNARSFGYVFNPLTVFWCLHRQSTPDEIPAVHCVIAEVHNTYGGRHAYLIQPASTDRETTASVEKAFYVSPFNPVEGGYDMRFTLPADQVTVSIALRREGAVMFAASLTGRRRPATASAVVRALVRHPMAALRVSLLIRFEGIRLFARGLPVVRRPA